jgi:NADH dehydrogenase
MNQTAQSTKPKVLIVGGGFAGIACARSLAESSAEITIADRNNYHLFQPLLYQVATAVLSPADIAAPIRRILRHQKNTTVVLEELVGVDLEKRLAHFSNYSLSYDYLVLANGATHSYFGHDNWGRYAPGLKTVDDALEIRRRVLMAFEEAEWEADPVARKAKLTFVVVGGGPTGVELAGALKEIAAQTIPHDFRHIDTTTARVMLVEAGPRLLPALAEKLGRRARRDLERMGVQVLLDSRVNNVCDGMVCIDDEQLPAANIIWAAGVKGADIDLSSDCERDRAGRLVVGPDLSLPGHPEVFVAGDLAHAQDRDTGRPVPGVAPAAVQMGRFVGRLIAEEVTTQTPVGDRNAFVYTDKGSMATIGRNRAVAQIFGLQFGGFVAWVFWGFVHLIPLFGFRKKLSVVFAWFWSYIAISKSCRLITGQPQMKVKQVRMHNKHRDDACRCVSPAFESSAGQKKV